ncbi:hypothetical protein VNI00_004983 [Paramarasmius palmivorus]|uniref:Uncharacterized protein n=1 Tax=Paramarasmius palmivorus TaxID=297713 RepID=A0AAW0DEC5_9AGAR
MNDEHQDPKAEATPVNEHFERKEDARKEAAAQKIQKAWRKRHNRAHDRYLTSDVRWKDAATHAKLKVGRTAADEGKNSPRERWERAIFFAAQLRDGNAMLKDDHEMNEKEIAEVQKHLETQHWLELVDGLDHGGGKHLSLDECPRDQLEKERITYLSSEQRLNYLVTIDDKGRLRWARNNELVDTTPGHWKDSGDGRGIVPDDMPERPVRERDSFDTSVSSLSSLDSNAATHYVDQPKGKHRWSRALRRYFTPKGIFNRLLRKTVQRNTWIWVTDRNYNLFVGIKDTGKFQHSTFLGGGLVTSAGLISVKDGLVYTLSPLSGHYRTTIAHFHKFLDVMEERGMDLRKARVSKAEAALWGIEHIAKWKKKQDEITKKGKQKVIEAGEDIALKLPAVNDDWKREVIQGRKAKEEKAQEKDVPSESPSSPTGAEQGDSAQQVKGETESKRDSVTYRARGADGGQQEEKATDRQIPHTKETDEIKG